MARLPKARRYMTEEIDRLRDQAHLPLAERQCPVCGHLGMRRYYRLLARETGASLITYIWCPACHTSEGSTAPAPAGGLVLDCDPMAELDAEQLRSLKADLWSYLTKLDEFWERGVLPQRLTRTNGRPYPRPEPSPTPCSQ